MKNGNNTDRKVKLVYFNLENSKEKEIFEWANESLLGFSGLVKQLLYKEMLKDKEKDK